MKKKFKIIGRTNGWIAARDSQFNGKTEIVIADNLTLKEAQRKLLSMFIECYDAYPTFDDSTRCFDYDSRTFSIEEEEEIN